MNVDVNGLQSVGMDIGGILGMDDHRDATVLPAECRHKVNAAVVLATGDNGAHSTLVAQA